MANFDMAVGIDGGTMDQGSKIIYEKLYPKLFTGSQKIKLEGIDFTVGWNVKSAPTFTLSAPSNPEALIRAHLMDWNHQYPVEKQTIVETYLNSMSGSIFQMNMKDVEMTVSSTSHSGTDQVDVTIIVEASSTNGVMTLNPIKATGKTSNPSDQSLINSVILPQAMTMARTILSGINLPPLKFGDVKLTAPNLIVTQNHIVALANLEGKSVPAPPFPSSWPSNPFFALLSSDAKMEMAKTSTSYINGKSFGKSGKIGFKIGDLHYGAKITMGTLSIADAGATSIKFETTGTGNVNAGIKIGCTNIGINYDLYAKPKLAGQIDLSIENGVNIVAKTSKTDTFVLVLKPSGNPIEWILSAITDPLLQTITAAFSPLISTLFNGYSYNTGPLPSIPIAIDGITLTATPTGVTLGDYNGMMSATGNINIS
ncbi:hypothetical protein [Psychroserpens sp. SPM9]|uniref:hypothetical protein n=1 Tax=Psychroserpens sp. SPM9 TaxID=2975598 RepID=UPI0021A87A53|nr:hypothetical protein [Psychroserpens sp. SPM9]MDG5490534.1 hypothetical protein [Psychroserpens sp. SPM9]